jgi:hypothetical protein
MSSHGNARRPFVAALALIAAAALGCGAPQRRAAASRPAVMPLPAPPTPRDSGRAAVVDPRGCDPAGKSIVVVERDGGGRPVRWRYFAPARRPRRARVLTCEAADRNGDGRIDTRYFYGAGGRLVLEQRDMDFDGQAEFVADYSQFPARGQVARPRDLN